MASFYKRGDYQWEAKIRKAGFPQLAKTFESKSDAVAWAAEVETEMRRGTFVSRALAERKTLGALIGQYVEEVSPLHRGAESEIARLKAMARRKFGAAAHDERVYDQHFGRQVLDAARPRVPVLQQLIEYLSD